MSISESLGKKKGRSKLKGLFYVAVCGAVILIAALLAIRLLSGRGMGLKSLPRTILSTARAVSNQKVVAQYSQGEYTNIIFLHHSTGNNLIEQGGMRELFSQAGYSFWDQSYNPQGLRDPNGYFTGYAYTVPRDNTDPDGLARVFSQKVYDRPLNALSGLLQHEVIIVKSCFAPANQISSDSQLEQLKQYYLVMRASMLAHQDKVFILATTPPLNPAETNSEEARRARELANWLKSDEFLTGQSNLFVFDLFDKLAESNPASSEVNMLRPEYRWGGDSHPNEVASQQIAPLFVDFVIRAVEEKQSEG